MSFTSFGGPNRKEAAARDNQALIPMSSFHVCAADYEMRS